ncbi:alanyl-tRNA editing protein [Petrotoga sp. 9PWA.NaAc.5.4]|uniref:alanyl-tRNA editing protein n=1 Tax=Petrotoga sp. 9PWA.NaAc.5.4 TaxID=1434328 RepID=UPI000CC9AE88|nr:alanyl-tRNA editing protein [Petrotoga sp. 9PWA.NaAc.5.4]PNR94806.1 threonyl-tRNA synthetase [Petrotoga sp. 9PWA.NaAc.5.4]
MVKIIGIKKEKDKYYVDIENSPFYPDGKGGQLGDRGKIAEANILEVKEGYVVLDKEMKIGEYEYEIDEDRRFDISQQHTAQHILSAAFEDIASLKTESFRMDEEYSTIDLNSTNISEEILEKAENLSNEIISQCLNVEEIMVEKEDLEDFKLRKSLSEKVIGKVRLIKISDFDISACGGFHVKNTGNINLVKIINTEKVKGDLTRVYFLAGKRALKDYYQKHLMLQRISLKLTSGLNDLERKIETMIQENKENKNHLKKLAEYAGEYVAKELMNNPIIIRNKKIVYFKKENEAADFLNNFIDLDQFMLIVEDEENHTFSFFSRSFSCKELIEKIKNKYGNEIKGGGSEVRGNIKGELKVEDIIKVLNDF